MYSDSADSASIRIPVRSMSCTEIGMPNNAVVCRLTRLAYRSCASSYFGIGRMPNGASISRSASTSSNRLQKKSP